MIVPDSLEALKLYESIFEVKRNTKTETHGIKNSTFPDPFGYIRMLHEVVREVSFEERIRAYVENK